MKANYVNEFLNADKNEQKILVLRFLLAEILAKMDENLGDRYQQYYYSRSVEYISNELKDAGFE